MDTPLCRTLGIEFPLLAFSHCRDVVASVTRSGGFGVFGAAGCTPAQLETALAWIDAQVDGRPYGVDLLVPENLSVRTEAGATLGDLVAQVPQGHRTFVHDLLRRYDVDPTQGTHEREDPNRPPPYQFETGEMLMDVAFRHPIRLIANALGVPPASMLERARHSGIPCAALVGARDHAVRQAEAGNPGARELVSYFVGQGVGLVDSIPTCRQVVAAFMTEFAEALEDMQRLSEA